MSNRLPRIGILSPGTEAGMQNWWDELSLGLKDLGYHEGRNFEFIWRFANGKFEALPNLARELVDAGADIIMPATPPAIRAAQAATHTIPIVFPLGSDPVETGLVSSIKRPGGNLTGLATMSRMQSGARMAFVRECLPSARRVALIRHSANYALDLQLEASRTAAPELELEIVTLDFANSDEIEPAFEMARQQGVDAVLPLSDPLAFDNAERIGRLSIDHGIPVISPFNETTVAGGLLSYGPDLSNLFRRSASMVDQILKGARPGDLPIGAPTEFTLGVNLSSARKLGLTIPVSIISRAKHVVD